MTKLLRNDTEQVCKLLMSKPGTFAFLNSKHIFDKTAEWLFFEKVFVEGNVLKIRRMPLSSFPKKLSKIKAPKNHREIAVIDISIHAMLGYDHVSKKWMGVYAPDIYDIRSVDPSIQEINVTDVKFCLDSCLSNLMETLREWNMDDFNRSLAKFAGSLSPEDQEKFLEDLKSNPCNENGCGIDEKSEDDDDGDKD